MSATSAAASAAVPPRGLRARTDRPDRAKPDQRVRHKDACLVSKEGGTHFDVEQAALRTIVADVARVAVRVVPVHNLATIVHDELRVRRRGDAPTALADGRGGLREQRGVEGEEGGHPLHCRLRIEIV